MKLNCFIAFFFSVCLFCGCASVSNRYPEGEDRVVMLGSTAEVSALVGGAAAGADSVDTIEAREKTALESATQNVLHTSGQQHTPKREIPKTVPSSAPNVMVNKHTADDSSALKSASKTTESERFVLSDDTNQDAPHGTIQGITFSGKVVVLGTHNSEKGEDESEKDASKLARLNKSIVTLTPKRLPNTEKNSERRVRTVDMKDKTYTPNYLAINANDTLEFVNSDKIKHNVFSRSGKNAFDLGTYAAGKKRRVTFNDTGIVKVYCNIHPNMATFVSVINTGYSAVSDKEGRFTIEALPAGAYTLNAWNIRGEVTMDVTVDTSSNYVEVTLPSSEIVFEAHKNKFGEKYKENSALFDDEFY